MKSAEDGFQVNRIPFILEAPIKLQKCLASCGLKAEGKTLDHYVAEHQDRSRNALAKSTEAAFNSWLEELRADQAQFSSERILLLGNRRFPVGLRETVLRSKL